MSQGVVSEQVEERVSLCRHHWVIDSAGGPTSKGVCRLCGAEQQFKNYLDDAPWDDPAPALRDQIQAALSSVGTTYDSEEES